MIFLSVQNPVNLLTEECNSLNENKIFLDTRTMAEGLIFLVDMFPLDGETSLETMLLLRLATEGGDFNVLRISLSSRSEYRSRSRCCL